ncbi:hypothetical protein ACQP2K_00660 [Microbispora siamensis]
MWASSPQHPLTSWQDDVLKKAEQLAHSLGLLAGGPTPGRT